MLKRKDLAKEFGLIVEQEIKNHNDKLLATNVALNKFNVKLDEFSRSLSHELDRINSYLKCDLTDRVEIQDAFDETIRELKDDVKNIDRTNADFIGCIKSDLDDLYINKLDKSEIPEVEDDICNLREETHKRFCGIREQIERNDKKSEQKLVVLAEMLRSEFRDRPAHIKKMEDHLLQKIEEHAINNSCLVQEVAACKKAALVTEKKYEYLQTRYQRLKKKIESGEKT